MHPLVIYVPIHYPTKTGFFEILDVLDAHDIGYVEIGIPANDPFMDGELIQTAHSHILSQGIDNQSILKTLKEIKERYSFKVILMTYKQAMDKFDMKKIPHCFYDAILCVDADLAVEDFSGFIHIFKQGMDAAAIDKCISTSVLFTYVVSSEGKTGGELSISSESKNMIDYLNTYSDAPPFVGFGVRTKEDVRQVLRSGAKGAIIGTEFIRQYQMKGKVGINKYIADLTNLFV